MGLWDAGWGCGKKSLTFLCRNKKNPTIGQPTQHHKARYLPFMFLDMEQPAPLAAANAADALLSLRCSAWLASLS